MLTHYSGKARDSLKGRLEDALRDNDIAAPVALLSWIVDDLFQYRDNWNTVCKSLQAIFAGKATAAPRHLKALICLKYCLINGPTPFADVVKVTWPTDQVCCVRHHCVMCVLDYDEM